MKDDKEGIYNLITDYLTGEISTEDKVRLSDWISASEENMKLFVRWKEVWMGAEQVVTEYDSEAAFARFKRRTMRQPDREDPKWSECYLSHTREMFQWAAVILLPILLTSTLYFYLQVKDYFSEQVVVTTIEGQSSSFMLPDGTSVILQQNSRLSYASGSFARGNRNVDFSGEAYFCVESDESHPFKITTSDALIAVVGTEFNLKSRDGEKLGILSLDKGKVNITSLRNDSTVRITAGEEFTLNRLTHEMRTRQRTEEEIKLDARARKTVTDEYSLAVKNIDDVENGYKMTVMVDKPLTPGTYEMSLNINKEEVNLRTSSSEEGLFQSGSGTASDPYIIATTEQMCNMRYALVKKKLTYFALAQDIDLRGVNWIPLNTYTDKYANWVSLDGRQHVIRNLTPIVSCSYSSFFGVLCGECKNVGFENVNISSVGLGAGVLGGYLGHPTYPGTTIIENCYFTGRISSRSYAGGIGGNIGGSTIIRGCCSSVDVTSVSSYAGGLVGKVKAALVMEECFCSGNVAGLHAGGIIGGGYDEKTPASRFSDIIAYNRSVYGSKSSDAFGFTSLKANKRNVFHAKGTFLNDNCLSDGLTPSQLLRNRRTWQKTWYSLGDTN